MTQPNVQPAVITGRTTTGKRRTFQVRVSSAGVALDISKSAGSMEFVRLDPEAADRFGAELQRAAAAAEGRSA